MKRVIALALLAASVILVLVVSASAGPDQSREVRRSGWSNTRPPTPSPMERPATTSGTSSRLRTRCYNRADTKQVGTSQGSCVRIVVGESWECSWTTFLPKGQITVQGPFSDTGDSVLAITGGTGKYRNARGEMELKFHNPAGTKFDFIFHVIG